MTISLAQDSGSVRTRKLAWLMNLVIDVTEFRPGSDLTFRDFRALGASDRRAGYGYLREQTHPSR